MIITRISLTICSGKVKSGTFILQNEFEALEKRYFYVGKCIRSLYYRALFANETHSRKCTHLRSLKANRTNSSSSFVYFRIITSRCSIYWFFLAFSLCHVIAFMTIKSILLQIKYVLYTLQGYRNVQHPHFNFKSRCSFYEKNVNECS